MNVPYTPTELDTVFPGRATPEQVKRSLTVTYHVKPNGELDLTQTALSFLMILTLRSRRLPKNSVRASIVESLGCAVITNDKDNEFQILLDPNNFPINHDLSHALALSLSPVEYGYADEVWVKDISFPAKFYEDFQGPAHGTDELRNFFGEHDVDKPLLGYTVSAPFENHWEESLRVLSGAVRGGVDFVADDMFNLCGYDLDSSRRRAQTMITAIDGASSGRKVPYFANLSSYALLKDDIASALLEDGVTGFVLNPFVTGWDHTANFVRGLGKEAPVFHTNMGTGIMSRQLGYEGTSTTVRTGIDESVISRLSRMCGADAVHAGTEGAECFDKEWEMPKHALVNDNDAHGYRKCFIIAEGDMTPLNYFANYFSAGPNLLVEANSAIYGHPTSPEAGAKAFKDAISILDRDTVGNDDEAKSAMMKSKSEPLKAALKHFQGGQ